jgi:ribonuclease P protein component
VPKKKFRRSVDRHRIMRLMREAWRTSKAPLYEAVPAHTQLHLFLIFTSTDMPDLATVRASIDKIIARLVQQQSPSPDA